MMSHSRTSKRKTHGEIEEFRQQLVGNIQNVQNMIAKAEQA